MKFLPLKTNRLLIRSLSLADAQALSFYRSIPEVSLYQSWKTYSLEDANKLITQMNEALPTTKGKWFQFGIELEENKNLIGDIGFLNTDEEGKSWIGFTLDSNYWNKGFAVEAVRAVLDFYASIDVTNVWASIDPANDSSKKLLLKLGFIIVEEKSDDIIFKNPHHSR